MTTPSDRPVIVGIDDSDASTKALRWAAHEAARRHRPISIVHVSAYLHDLALSPATAATVTRELAGRARSATAEAARIVTDLEPGIEVRTEVHQGNPTQFLTSRSTAATMIVLGSHGSGAVSGAIPGAILGSISQSVAAHAYCPVVVINTDQPTGALAKQAVVVGVSSSPGGARALRFAFEEADRRQASIIAVRSWGGIEWGLSGLDYSGTLQQNWERVEERVLDDCLSGPVKDFPTVAVRKRLVNLRAQWALQNEALGAELLVVGCHRADDHWFSRLGPIASWLLHRAPCPIAIVGQPHEATPKSDPAQPATTAR